MDLTEFLNARLDEDEAAIKAVEDRSEPWRGQWKADGNLALRTYNDWVLAVSGPHVGQFEPGVLAHIARHDPARALREVEAKRAIVAMETATESNSEWSGWAAAHDDALRHLAAVYSDHPDYQPEWKP